MREANLEARELIIKLNTVQTEIINLNKKTEVYLDEIQKSREDSNKTMNDCQTLLLKEQKTYNILLSILWIILLVSIFSFLILPVSAFLILVFLDKKIAIEIFVKYFQSDWFPMLVGICGIIAATGLGNLYRLHSELKKQLSDIENKIQKKNQVE